MIRLLFAAVVAAFPPLEAYLGKTVDDVIKEFGEYRRSWEEGAGLKHYVFRKDGLFLGIASVNGTIEQICYRWEAPPDEKQVMVIFQEGDRKWNEVKGVSDLEKREVSSYKPFYVFRKFVRDDHEATAYYYHVDSSSYPYNLLIFTEAFRQAEAKSIPKPSDSIDPRDREYYQEKRLKCGYHLDSQRLLDDFLETWADESKPIEPSTLQVTGVILAAYQIFEDFYDPKHLNKITGNDDYSDLYEGFNFLIVQDHLTVTIRENFIREEFMLDDFRDAPLLKIAIKDFNPRLEIEGTRCLFLNAFYKKCLTDFLGDEQLDVGQGNIMSPARETGESARRLEYLSKKIKIIKGHWEGWHLESHPYLFSIDFNQALDAAEVHFRLQYQGGEARYKKKDGAWMLEESKLTWIE